MQFQNFQPVLPVERKCVEVNGKAYCEEHNMTKREFGVALIAVALILVVILGAAHEFFEDRVLNGWLIIGVPFTLLVGWLLFS